MNAAIHMAQEKAAETEALGRLHPEVIRALTDCGAFRFWVPQAYGGPGLSVSHGVESIINFSRADGATGWCVMIANTTALAAHYLSPQWAEKIYGDPNGCTGGFGMPAGTATLTDGGLLVSGEWAWGSGTEHCSWIGGGVTVVDANGQLATTSDGARAPFVFFDRDQVELLDTWHVSGLKGTASTHYRVSDAFVPQGRWAQFIGGTPFVTSPNTRVSFFGTLACGVAAVCIGLAERAIEELINLGSKTPSGSAKSLAERNAVQAELAMAQANVGQARAYLFSVLDQAAGNAEELADDTRVALRLAASAATKRSVEVVDACYHAAGGAAVYSTSPIQRVFRDVHVATQHAMVAERTFEPLGRYGFGLPTSLTTL